jgi:hypothetical protein
MMRLSILHDSWGENGNYNLSVFSTEDFSLLPTVVYVKVLFTDQLQTDIGTSMSAAA